MDAESVERWRAIIPGTKGKGVEGLAARLSVEH